MKRSALKCLALLTACLVSVTATKATDFSPWMYRAEIEIAPGSEAVLRDFPTLILLGSNITGFAYEQFALPSGGDLRFSGSENGSEFAYEIESWNTNGESAVWVRVPVVTNGAVVLAFWGNAEAAVPSYTTDGSTWNGDYLGVWHLNGDLLDVSGNGNQGVNFGAADTSGMIGLGKEFNGSDAYVRLEDVPPAPQPPLGAERITLSAWFLRRGAGDRVNTGTGGFSAVEPILTKGRGEADGDERDMNYFLGIRPTDRVLAADLEEGAAASFPGLNRPIVGSTPAADGIWNHAAATYDGTWRLYLNGVQDSQIYVGEPMRSDSVQPAAIAGALNSYGVRDGAFNGFLDEVRISRVARSGEWILACWLNTASNGLFCRYGAVQAVQPDAPRVNAVAATNVTVRSAWLNGHLVSTGCCPTSVTFFWGPNDAGTNTAAWSRHRDLGVLPEGPFSTLVTGLTEGVTHYFRCRASNDAATAWGAESISFVPANWVELTVAGDPKPYGTSSPYGYGTHQIVAPLAIANAALGSPAVDPAGTRLAVTGWRGDGNVPSEGQSSVVEFVLATNSSLTWIWEPTHQYLTVAADEGGSADAASGWRIHNTTSAVSALPDRGFRFARWSGDVPGSHLASNTVQLVMDRPRSVTAHFALDGTAVGGTLPGATVWRPDDSPYIVTNELVVPRGSTLSLEPGTTVQIMSSTRIRIYGTLQAVGTASEPIVFENHPSQAYGGCLSFEGGGLAVSGATGIFERCSFTALDGPIAALEADDSWLTVASCIFSNIPGKAVRPSYSRVRFVGNEIHDTGEGVNLLRCAGIIASNFIWNILGNADALDVDFSWEGQGDGVLILEWNIMQGAEHYNADAIDLAESDAIVRYNRISHFGDKGISLGPSSTSTIFNNLILRCETGVAIKDGSTPTLLNNTIYGCASYGIHSYEKGEGSGGGGHGSLTNSIIWDCASAIVLEDDSTLAVGYSVIDTSQVWTGPGNGNENPLFRNAPLGDLRLTGDSLCVNAGGEMLWPDGTVDLKGDPRVLDGAVDIGAYEYIIETPPRMQGIWSESEPEPADLAFSWLSMSNRTYTIQFSTNLAHAWRVLTNRLRSTPPSNTYTDDAPGQRGFYRILLEDNL